MAEQLSRFPVDMGTIPVYLGDSTNLLTARILEDDGVTPVDLSSDWSAWRAVWRRQATSESFVELDVTVSGEAVSVDLTPEITREMGARGGVFDVQATSNAGQVRTWFKGMTSPTRDVTR